MNLKFWENNKIVSEKIKVKKHKSLNETIEVEDQYRERHTVKDWTLAVEWAEMKTGEDGIKYHDLMDIYKNVELDTHITALTETIYNRVFQTPFAIFTNNEINEEKTEIFKKAWFAKFVRLLLESNYYPYTLIQFIGVENGTFTDIELVDRYYVRPEQQGVASSISTEKIAFSFEKKPLKDWTLFLKSPYHLGLYNKLCRLYIMSRNNIEFWAVYNDLFTTPTYVVKTEFDNKEHRNNLINWLRNRRHSGSVIVGLSEEIEAIQNTGTGYTAYEDLLNTINKEFSKILIGSTMVLEDGSSRSQAEVHESNTKQFINAKKITIQNIINEKLLPKMRNLGFNITANDTFKYINDEVLNTEQQTDIITKLAPYFEFDVSEISEKTGLELSEKEQVEVEKNNEQPKSLVRAKMSKII